MPHDPHHHGHGEHAPNHSHGSHCSAEHGHSHAPASFGTAFAVGVTLNAALVLLQLGVGAWGHSTALLADAVHNFGDVLGLLFAWLASVLGRRRPTARRTYGWGRGTILAALANASVLLVGTGAIAVEAMQRLFNTVPVAGPAVMATAAAAILINGGVALLFIRGRQGDLNIRAAFLHMASDAGVSAGVLLAATAITLTGAQWLDPLASLAISAVILLGSWKILREAVGLAMDMVPPGIDPASVRAALLDLPGVIEVHDLHIWALSTTQTAATAHLVAGERTANLAPLASALLHDEFGIDHCTMQIESEQNAYACTLRPESVI